MLLSRCADDLRFFALFDGLTGDQLSELVEGGDEVRIEPGVELFHEGEHADYWSVLVKWSSTSCAASAARTPWSAWWTCRAPLGGRVPCPGTNTASTSPPPGERPPAVLRAPAEVLRDRLNAWFPLWKPPN